MKASFIKRLGAYMIDFLLLTLVTTMIGYIIPVSTKKQELSEELITLEEKLLDEDITNSEYLEEYQNILPEYDKENIGLNICNLVFILGYFVIIPVINDGQTIGKKLLKIKITKEKGNLTIKDMIIRNFITTSLLQLMISSTIVYIVDNNVYFMVSIIISFLQILLVIITSFMIIYKKDRNGVQDLITKTSVVEVK